MISVKSLLALSVKNISRKKIRTMLSVIGIILGIFLYTSIGVATTSFEKEIQTSITYLQGAIFLQQKGVPTPVLSVLNRSIESDLLSAFGEKILGISPQIWYVNGSSFSLSSMVVIGVFPQQEIKTGGYLSQADWSKIKPPKDNDTGWIVVGESVANMLGLKIGDVIKIGSYPNNVSLKVINIFKVGGLMDFLSLASILDINKVDRLRDLNNTVSSFIVKLKDPRDTEIVVKYIENKYPQVDIIMEKDLASRASFILDNIEKFTYLVSALSVLIGVLGITNTVFMNVSERRKEIGILKATGWSNLEVMVEILFESLVMGVIGTIIGIILGVIGVQFAVEYFHIHIRITVDILYLLQPFTAGLIIALLAGIPPAYSAMRISPIESLRDQ